MRLIPSIPEILAGRLARTLGGVPAPMLDAVVLMMGFGFALPALGGVDALGAAALDLEQPRIRNLRRVARLVSAYALIVTTALAFIGVALVPDSELTASASTPLAAIAQHLAVPA